MLEIERVLQAAISDNASDIHLVVGQRPALRIDGRLSSYGSAPLSLDVMESFLHTFLHDLLDDRKRSLFARAREIDFAFAWQERRFRALLYRVQGTPALALRILPECILTLEDLGLPPALSKLKHAEQGLLLFGGKTGSGKSTTIAAFLDEINRERVVHIVTLEDPVEVVFTPVKALISQRELGRDFVSFPAGLKAALRAMPDILFIGEIRERASMEIALQAAETGVLVVSTLHTRDAVEAALRIESMFSVESQARVRNLLASSLLGIFSQELVETREGRRRPIVEVLLRSPAIVNLLRTGKYEQIPNALLSGRALGMQTLEEARHGTLFLSSHR